MSLLKIIRKNTWLLIAVFSLAGLQAPAFTSSGPNAAGQSVQLDVPYVPTPQKVVDRMLQMAEVKRGDTVYDLGSGDGRIVVTAAKKFGAKGVGIDLDPERVKEARENVKNNKVQGLVTIKEGNALTADVSNADVITLYLLPQVNLQLRPKLQKLEPGTRIVSHDFDMGDWEPLETETVMVDGISHTVYLWVVGEDESVAKRGQTESL